MKEKIGIIGILFFIGCCFSARAQVLDSTMIDTTSNRILVKEMTCRSFIKEIYDYRRRSTPWLYKGKRPALLVVYANWCSPCRRMTPIINKLAGEFDGKIKFYRINADSEKDLTLFLKANYIPLFVFVPLKEDPIKCSGTMAEETLRTKLKELIQNSK